MEPPTGDSRVILRANFGLLLNALVDLGEGLKGQGGAPLTLGKKEITKGREADRVGKTKPLPPPSPCLPTL